MNDDELESLLKDLESDLVERKASLSDSDRIREAICAFANDLPDHRKPGIIFIGANNDGSCSGIEITDELLLKLSNMRDDGAIQPFPSMIVEKRELNQCQLAVLIVRPSRAPPIRFKGVTWIRVGPRRARATPEEELILAERRRYKDLPFDLQPLPSAMIDDLDLDLFEREYLPLAVDPDVLEQDYLNVENNLRALRFLSTDGYPTVLGVIVLGKDPLQYIPGAYIQFLRFEGDSLTDPIRDRKEIDGPLLELLRRLDDVLEAHNTVSTSITSGPIEVPRPEYPLPALQQLARNAVLHRTYKGTNAPVRIYWFSDRVEIHSPGGPYGQVTKENFGKPGVTDYRNPHLAESMKVLGYVQRFGLGIQIAREQLAKNGNPDPEFTVETTNVLVTIRRHS
ncbi:ATP-binding protein [Candidatus Methanocrinis natronophilus]|uniref:ATP-binding protein n=1 Tax=Candidatus Methanocrinis natronophilus TaxID=3033396 RepID=A0ABT5X9W1_9EURY|nr:ATP-binding protein [Candidatus Methanocrinis natronophilus]MDF0591495.1 ATP-binding protein [Candidatus Methanocrinis natronophilus]